MPNRWRNVSTKTEIRLHGKNYQLKMRSFLTEQSDYHTILLREVRIRRFEIAALKKGGIFTIRRILMNMLWPIALAVCADLMYQICAKSPPEALNPFASLTITYLIGAAASVVIFFITSRGGSLFQEWHNVNWTAFVLGLAIVGLEAGCLYMYKVGWAVNTGYIVKALIMGIALIAVGALLYHEKVTGSKVAGIAVCLLGLYLINR